MQSGGSPSQGWGPGSSNSPPPTPAIRPIFSLSLEIRDRRGSPGRGKTGTKGRCMEGLSSDTAAFVSLRIFWDLVACSDRLWEGVKRGSWTPLWPHAFLGRAYSTLPLARLGALPLEAGQMAACSDPACLAVTWSTALASWPRRAGSSGRGRGFRPGSAPLSPSTWDLTVATPYQLSPTGE